jgi:ATP-dependent helicase/nuclease subunit B
MQLNSRCLAHLNAGGLILTADLRQARILRRLHDRAQLAAGRSAWPTAQVLPLEAWLAREWRLAGAEREGLPIALPAVAMRWLWRQRVAGDVPDLLDPAEIGARARASWLLLREYGGEVSDLGRWPLTRDQQAFFGWARAVERELQDRGACDAADLARCFVANDMLPPPAMPLLLVGFRNPAPADAALLAALSRHGWRVEHASGDADGNRCLRYAAADPEAERATMIAWLQERLAERPDGVHGLIVPDLERQRGGLERALESALQPALELAGAPRERVFDLAGGPPLLSRPLVELAFEALRYALGQGDWIAATRLLRSPCIAGGAVEREARVRLDIRLRRDGRMHPANPVDLAGEARRGAAPALAATLESAAAACAGPLRRDAAAWAETFGRCLAAWGWPGPSTELDSSDWQAATRLGELLRELAALAGLAGALTAGQALAQLGDLAATPFQPEGGEPAVFVLDRWEDPGLAFDSLWVSGLTSASWPRPVRIDPFLPIDAQRRLGMPYATPEGCVRAAEAVVRSWQAQAAELVMAWPEREDDTDVDASPLVPQNLESLSPPGERPARAMLQFVHAVLEPVGDDPAPMLAGSRAPGGARVLELQSACPFRAFAELRLGATPCEEPEAGIDRRIRGIVLHRALERFWHGLATQANLLALAPSECGERVTAAVERAMAESAPAGVGPRARDLEREWQCRAIGGLLELERGRAPFAVVETERELSGRLGGLEFRLRVDRVDAQEGVRVVFDYKTGDTRASAWRGARMDAPQLPLYAVLHPERPAAIVLARVGLAGAQWVGVGDASVTLAGVKPAAKFALTEDRQKGFDWRSITEHWWAWLDALARNFAAGEAAVDPKLAGATCRRCHLGGLCRVDTPGAREEPVEEAGDDA